MDPAEQVASTRIAPRSSTVASVRRNTDEGAGMRLRKKPKMAMAKAISVAMGTVRATRLPPPPNSAAVARYTTMGVTMPPTAAMQGSSALRTELRLRAQLELDLQPDHEEEDGHEALVDPAGGDSACPPTGGPIGDDQNAGQAALVGPPTLARASDAAVAARSATEPSPSSCSSLRPADPPRDDLPPTRAPLPSAVFVI